MSDFRRWLIAFLLFVPILASLTSESVMAQSVVPLSDHSVIPASITIYPNYNAALAANAAGINSFQPSIVKYWTDSTAASLPASGNYTYSYFDSMSGTVKTNTISNGLAAEVSIPTIWPAYTVAPTKAVLSLGPTISVPLNQGNLSTDDQANALLAAITNQTGLALSLEVGSNGAFTYVPNGETRKQWVIYETNVTGSGTYWYVGNLIMQEYANGVGAPGTWALNAQGAPTWVSTWVPAASNAVTVPAPILNPLPAGDKFVDTAFNVWGVQVGSAPAASSSSACNVDLSPVTTAIATLQEQITALQAQVKTVVGFFPPAP